MYKFLALTLLLAGSAFVGCKKPEEAAPATPAAPAEAPASTEPAAS